MSLKIIEKKIDTQKKVLVYNFLLAIFSWIFSGLVIYYFFWIKNNKIFNSDYYYLIPGIISLFIVLKFSILAFYKKKYAFVVLAGVIPFVLYCLFFVFVILWNGAKFVGPSF